VEDVKSREPIVTACAVAEWLAGATISQSVESDKMTWRWINALNGRNRGAGFVFGDAAWRSVPFGAECGEYSTGDRGLIIGGGWNARQAAVVRL
jgi:hypothetical protein